MLQALIFQLTIFHLKNIQISKYFSAPDAWSNSQPANMAQIQDLEVQCEKDLFRVRIKFDRPFYGMVFSKGFYSNVNCVHVPAGLGQTQATFDIAMGQVSAVWLFLYKSPFNPFTFTPQRNVL